MTLQHLRSSTANKRPTPAAMSDGQLAMNTNLASPGLFLKDSNGDLVKVGPVHVGTTAPNATPAVGGQAGNSKGEQWLDTSSSRYVFKIWDGTAWRTEDGEFVNTSGDTMTGALGIIAGSAATPGVFFSGDTNTGIYSPGADTLAFVEGGVEAMRIDSSGRVGIGTSAPNYQLHVTTDFAVGASGFNQQLSFTNDTIQSLLLGTGYTALKLNPLGGNVGIGTSSPARTLDVTGTARISSVLTMGSYIQGTTQLDLYGDATSSNGLRLDSSGRVGIGTSSPGTILHTVNTSAGAATVGAFIQNSSLTAGTEVRLGFAPNTNVVGDNRYSWIGAVNGTGSNDSSLTFATTPGGTGATERMRIDSSGRLLVGTSTAGTSRVRIQGAAGNSTYSVEGLSVAVGGDTTNPNGRGVVADFGAGGVADSAATYGATINLGASSVGQWGVRILPAGSFAISDYYPGGAYVGAANPPTARMSIDTNGKIGIGTSSPNAALDVRSATTWIGDGTTDAFLQFNQSATAANRWHIGAGSSNALIFYKGTYGTGSETARIDSSGRLLVGTSTARSNFFNGAVSAALQLEGTGTNRRAAIIGNDFEGSLILASEKSGAVGGNTVLASGDPIGAVTFQGSDGTEFVEAANITAVVDGTPGANDMPGRLVFSTTADGAATPTERMRIDSVGVVSIQTTLLMRYAGINVILLGYDPAGGGGGPTGGAFVIVNKGNDGSGSSTSGVALGRSATSWATYSDERAKANLVPIEDGLSKVGALRAVIGHYAEDSEQTSRSFLIAQDVQVVLPQAVDASDPDKLSLRYTEVIPLLVAALKESKERIETLEARLTVAGIE